MAYAVNRVTINSCQLCLSNMVKRNDKLITQIKIILIPQHCDCGIAIKVHVMLLLMGQYICIAPRPGTGALPLE